MKDLRFESTAQLCNSFHYFTPPVKLFLINIFKLVYTEVISRLMLGNVNNNLPIRLFLSTTLSGESFMLYLPVRNCHSPPLRQRQIRLFRPPPHRGGSFITYFNYHRKRSLDYDCSCSMNKMDSVLFLRWQSIQLNYCRLWKRGAV